MELRWHCYEYKGGARTERVLQYRARYYDTWKDVKEYVENVSDNCKPKQGEGKDVPEPVEK